MDKKQHVLPHHDMNQFILSHTLSSISSFSEAKMPGARQRSGRPIATARGLPPCTGPKLGAFQHQNSPIKWLERLDEYRKDYSDVQGCVFRATIRSKEYAIKVVSYILNQVKQLWLRSFY